jgi:hypothetical protein
VSSMSCQLVMALTSGAYQVLYSVSVYTDTEYRYIWGTSAWVWVLTAPPLLSREHVQCGAVLWGCETALSSCLVHRVHSKRMVLSAHDW